MDDSITHMARATNSHAFISTAMATDYTYVFGAQRGGERHDPHIRKASAPPEPDLRRIAKLIRGNQEPLPVRP